MTWLRFRMTLSDADNLLQGVLSFMEGDTPISSFTATSGLSGYQQLCHQSARGRGPIPSCKRLGITNYSVRTTPFDERGVTGVEGNFYYVEPDPVDVPPLRGEFGIHFDANIPGSAGCIVFPEQSEWEKFQDLMMQYKMQGHQCISLIVEYNVAETYQEDDVPGTSHFTVTFPRPGMSIKAHQPIEFGGAASDKVATIITEVGPGGPFKIGEVQPEKNQWSFVGTLVTPGLGRPFSFRAFDLDGNFLQRIDFKLTITPASSNLLSFKIDGLMSTFGGPDDSGMDSNEGLALVQRYEDLPEYFLRPPTVDEGLGRLLNPQKFYLACRWNYGVISKSDLLKSTAQVTNPLNGKSAEAKPVDWGPNENTGRVADLSPGLAEYLGLETDDRCIIELSFLQA
jgi:hypothetical protein